MEKKSVLKKNLIIIEPFYCGSHRQLIDVLTKSINAATYDVVTMPGKKWHWRARTAALYISQKIPLNVQYQVLFCSSVLNLCELVGLRTDLHSVYKVVYFHENQLVYPIRKETELDFQFGYNQILAALTADKVLFNSVFNMTSFLDNISSFFRKMPDCLPKNIPELIKQKSFVLYFPTMFENIDISIPIQNYLTEHRKEPLHIVWPHRWEHDKNPESLFEVVIRLKNNNLNFKLSVLGENFSENPKVFANLYERLKENILNWGFVDNKQSFYKILASADVVLSTANHEFFGVSMMEATFCCCFPLCPNRLSYPELFPSKCLYNTDNQLYKRLKEYCKKPWLPLIHYKHINSSINLKKYSWSNLKKDYYKHLQILTDK